MQLLIQPESVSNVNQLTIWILGPTVVHYQLIVKLLMFMENAPNVKLDGPQMEMEDAKQLLLGLQTVKLSILLESVFYVKLDSIWMLGLIAAHYQLTANLLMSMESAPNVNLDGQLMEMEDVRQLLLGQHTAKLLILLENVLTVLMDITLIAGPIVNHYQLTVILLMFMENAQNAKQDILLMEMEDVNLLLLLYQQTAKLSMLQESVLDVNQLTIWTAGPTVNCCQLTVKLPMFMESAQTVHTTMNLMELEDAD